jgi:tRNA A-37 threonylcarbamoyl transferase component Bud32
MSGDALRGDAPSRFVAEADRAEGAGDLVGAALALRTHLERHPQDGPTRLRFAQLLLSLGERAAARQVLAPLDGARAEAGSPVGLKVERALAEIDEAEGAIASAALRWERLLADDIDDAQARAHLARLRPTAAAAWLDGESRPDRAETLISPEGVETLRFRLLREIGRGATATVYLARDEALDLLIALKVLHPQLADARRSDSLRRFFAEARLAAAIRHPGAVAIYDVDEAAHALAMEWIPGGTLRSRLRENAGGLPTEELGATARGLLGTLATLHGRGIVHGDLKPSNLLLRAPGEVVIADFGAAELVGAARPGADAGGTPLYLAPEQFRGAPSSPATDLYAAGAVLFEMSVGHPLRSHAGLLRGSPDEALSAERLDLLAAHGPRWRDLVVALLSPDPTERKAEV